MLVGEVRLRAKQWVEREASRIPGFLGAFLTGSTKWRPAGALHPPSSDVDVRVVVEDSAHTTTHPKFRYQDILIEVAIVSRGELGSPEEIVANPHLAGSLWRPVLLADPAGALAALATRVSELFPQRAWVEKRMAALHELVLLRFRNIAEAESFPEQVTCWLFGTSATTLVLLSAGLRNLTVRRRYAESRELLAAHGRLDFHEEMLRWLGCADMRPDLIRDHLHALTGAFDATSPYVDPSFRFAADLQQSTRPIAIEGSYELVDAGLHREAVFWLVATYSRCLQGLRSDAPDAVRERCDRGFRALLRDLAIGTRADLDDRTDHIRENLGRLAAVADEILAATPEIVPT